MNNHMNDGGYMQFLWGVATSSYQVEGGNKNNDWHYFTTSSVIKDRIFGLTTPSMFYRWIKQIELESAGEALKTWDPYYYTKDFDTAKSLGLNAFKISIEWSRIQPEKNDWDFTALERYRQMIKTMREKNLIPIVALHHLTLPIWVLTPPLEFKRKIGQCIVPSPLRDLPLKDPPNSDPFWKSLMGWENPRTVEAYLEYVSKVVSELKCEVDYWTTLSEPVGGVIGGGYISGIWPPGFFLDGNRSKKVLHNLIEAHVGAYNLIKKLDDCDSDGDGLCNIVGFSHLMAAVKPVRSKLEFSLKHNQKAAENFCYFMNDYFINAVVNGEEDLNYLETLERHNHNSKNFVVREEWKNKIDFIGLNYYRQVPVYYSPLVALSSAKFIGGALINNLNLDRKNSHGLLSDLGWEIYPRGLYDILIKIKANWNKPVLITENGIADKSDKYRAQFIVSHLDQVRKAIDDNARVIGYLHWSFMDNYEWQESYSENSRFGLFRVLRTGDHLERRLTDGAKALKMIIQSSHSNIDGALIPQSVIENAIKVYGSISEDGMNLISPTEKL